MMSSFVTPRFGMTSLAVIHAPVLVLIGLLYCTNATAALLCIASASGPSVFYDPSNSGPTDGLGNLDISCTYVGLGTSAVAYQLQLNAGFSNSYAARSMRYLVSNTLSYNLYTDPARSIIWGDGTSGSTISSDSYSMTAGNIVRSYPIYLRIPAGQSVLAGIYLDTISITMVY